MEHKHHQDQIKTRHGHYYRAAMEQHLEDTSIIEFGYPLQNLQHYVTSRDIDFDSFNNNNNNNHNHNHNHKHNHNLNTELNTNDQLRAAKFVTLMLARLWRRRRAEVCSIQAISHKYKEHTDRIQNELIVRNQMLNIEQRRNEQLATQLRNALNRIHINAYCPIDNTGDVKQYRNREANLRRDLDAKILECENIEQLLESCKKELFHELTKYRENSKQLADEQRRTIYLEMLNADLENELLMIKKQYNIQNESVNRNREQLDIAYETLRKYEQDFSDLEIKHNELKRITEIDKQQNTHAAKNLRFVQNVLFFQASQRWDTLYSCWYHIGACFLNCFIPVCPMPSKPDYTVRLCLALVFLLASFY